MSWASFEILHQSVSWTQKTWGFFIPPHGIARQTWITKVSLLCPPKLVSEVSIEKDIAPQVAKERIALDWDD